MSNTETEFRKKYPDYDNPFLDNLRKTEFPQFEGKVYADWTGGAIPPNLLIEKHSQFLQNNMMGNPHSHHAPSAFAMEQVLETRKAILGYLKANPEEYDVIFTSNATAAILLLQHYIYEGGELLLTADNHNSVNGLREIAKRKGGVVRYAPITSELTINADELNKRLSYPRSWQGNKLFCFPAKSNYSGIMHSLDWVNVAQEKGWDVMLDAAAFLANNRLDLSKIKPDFIPVSFYKLFGYPTGIGCLIVKKEKYKKLYKSWFAGGSILLVSVMMDFFAPESLGYARFEDGTVNFSGIPAIKNGLGFMEIIGDVKPRVTALASWLHDELNGMEANGNKVVVHNSRGNDTVAFNIEIGGKIVDSWYFERAATKAGIFVRTGCFCDPGVNEKLFDYDIGIYEGLYNSEIKPDAITIENLKEFASDKPIGAIRASFGYMSSFNDVQKFAEFTKEYLQSFKLEG